MEYIVEIGVGTFCFIVGVTIGSFIRGFGNTGELSHLRTQNQDFRNKIDLWKANAAKSKESTDAAKKMLDDINAMNTTTAKTNDFYAGKISKIQAILNEKA